MRVLARGEERVLAGRAVVIAHRRARLHGIGDQPVVGQLQLDHLRRVREGGIDRRRIADMPVVAKISGHLVMHQRRPRRERVRDRSDPGKILPGEHDLFRGILRRLPARRDHHGNRIADMADFPHREHGMRRLRHRRAVLVLDLPAAGQPADLVRLHVGAGIDRGNARHRGRGGGVDRDDPGVRPVRAAQMGVELSRAVDIVGVMAGSA